MPRQQGELSADEACALLDVDSSFLLVSPLVSTFLSWRIDDDGLWIAETGVHMLAPHVQEWEKLPAMLAAFFPR